MDTFATMPEVDGAAVSVASAASGEVALAEALDASQAPGVAEASSLGASCDAGWAAILAGTGTGATFVYAVTTTGIYCRVGCPSREPRRAHVRFFAGPAEAEAAGFRACKRCRPDEQSARCADTLAVERACRRIDRSDEFPSLEELAREAGLSRFHFHRVFRSIMGLTPRAYAVARRRARLGEALRTSRSVTEAAYRAGFSSSAPLYAASIAELGMEPSRYRAHGAGTTIRFAVTSCSLGAILVAATERGICAVDLGDDPQRLIEVLQWRFARATFARADGGFERLVATVVGRVEAKSDGASRDVPLDARSTAFQQRVRRALQQCLAIASSASPQSLSDY